MSPNSRNSVWCKYELNFFRELKRPIFIIQKEDIENNNFKIETMKNNWFVDPDYKQLALMEGSQIIN